MLTVSFTQLLTSLLPWVCYCAIMSKYVSLSPRFWGILIALCVLLITICAWTIERFGHTWLILNLYPIQMMTSLVFLFWQIHWIMSRSSRSYVFCVSTLLIIPTIELATYLSSQPVSIQLMQFIYASFLAGLFLFSIGILVSYLVYHVRVSVWKVVLSFVLSGPLLNMIERTLQNFEINVTYWWPMEILYTWLPARLVFKDVLGWPYWANGPLVLGLIASLVFWTVLLSRAKPFNVES